MLIEYQTSNSLGLFSTIALLKRKCLEHNPESLFFNGRDIINNQISIFNNMIIIPKNAILLANDQISTQKRNFALITDSFK